MISDIIHLTPLFSLSAHAPQKECSSPEPYIGTLCSLDAQHSE
jgi:hypothetical protein